MCKQLIEYTAYQAHFYHFDVSVCYMNNLLSSFPIICRYPFSCTRSWHLKITYYGQKMFPPFPREIIDTSALLECGCSLICAEAIVAKSFKEVLQCSPAVGCFYEIETEIAVLDYPLQILDHKSETPNSSFNYPKLRLRCHSGLFNLSLGCFTFCNPRLFKSGDYLNPPFLKSLDYHISLL